MQSDHAYCSQLDFRVGGGRCLRAENEHPGHRQEYKFPALQSLENPGGSHWADLKRFRLTVKPNNRISAPAQGSLVYLRADWIPFAEKNTRPYLHTWFPPPTPMHHQKDNHHLENPFPSISEVRAVLLVCFSLQVPANVLGREGAGAGIPTTFRRQRLSYEHQK